MATIVPMKSGYHYLRFSRFVFTGAFLLLLLSINVMAQKEEKIKAVLKPSDIKKLEKADALYTKDADTYMEEANQLLRNISIVKNSTEFDDKAKRKEVKQLERKARRKITAASDLYCERNGIRYRLYKTYIERFWLKFEGDETTFHEAKEIEEQSNDFYFQALTGRNEAKAMPGGSEKIQKLKDANESEDLAIDKQLTVLGMYYSIDLTESPVKTPGSAGMNQPSGAEGTATPPSAAPARQDIQPNRISQPAVTQESDGVPAAIPEAKKSDVRQPPSGVTVTSPDHTQTQAPATAASTEPPQQQQIPAAKATEAVQELPPAKALPEISYRIQVAASKTKLPDDKVAKLTAKPYTMAEVEENGWYKYHIVAGSSFEQAKKTLRECGVENAFIIPYKNGRRITIAEATQTNP